MALLAVLAARLLNSFKNPEELSYVQLIKLKLLNKQDGSLQTYFQATNQRRLEHERKKERMKGKRRKKTERRH
jgi:hypothetical protein